MSKVYTQKYLTNRQTSKIN